MVFKALLAKVSNLDNIKTMATPLEHIMQDLFGGELGILLLAVFVKLLFTLLLWSQHLQNFQKMVTFSELS